MKIYARASFDRALKALAPEVQELILAGARRLPEVFGRPHGHFGLGIRRLGPFYDYRVGLKWRVLFLVENGDAVLLTAGNHDDVVKFVRGNG